MSNALLIKTAAHWHICRELAEELLARDARCIYCGREFELTGSRSRIPSWEHIVNDLSKVDANNIALCCVGCNASKGRKTLTVWLESSYCKDRGITGSSLGPIAIQALRASEAPGVASAGSEAR